MIVVGLTGFARSGKDTLADHLVAHHGFTKLSFARPLKEMLLALDPILGVNRQLEGIKLSQALADLGGNKDELKRRYPEYRRLLQVLGTDCIRAADENFWANRVADELSRMDYDAKVVIPDVRFDNEAQLILEGNRPDWGGTPITNHYFAGTVFRINRQAVEPKYGHESEMNVKFISVVDSIDNNGTVPDFLGAAERTLEEWGVIEEGVER